MNRRTFIQWCDYTYNPWIGCTKVSPGCAHCYAAERDKRHMQEKVDHWGKGAPRYLTSESTRNAPYKWNKRPWICDKCGLAWAAKPTACEGYVPAYHGEETCGGMSFHRARVFLGSLMDIFDDEVSADWLHGALRVVAECPELDFLFVTKRPELWRNRVGLVSSTREFPFRWCRDWLEGKAPANVWMITSTENQDMADKRIPELLKIPAAVHGLSCEPLLGPIELLRSLNGYDRLGYRKPFEKLLKSEGVDWVIAGGESGASARPMDVQWMHEIQQQCQAAGVAYFAKQLGSFPITENANLHDWPDSTRLVNGCTEGAAAACAELKDKKGGKMEEWPPELCVRQWPAVNR